LVSVELLLEELFIPPPQPAELALKVQLVTAEGLLLEALDIPPPVLALPFWRVNPWRREEGLRFRVDRHRPPGPPLAALGR
jgi:hypothetical protein